MNMNIRQQLALRRVIAHARRNANVIRTHAPRKPGMRPAQPLGWLESWPAIGAGLGIAAALLFARAWGAL